MGAGCGGVGRGRPRWGPGLLRGVPVPPALLMQGMGSLRLGSRAVMYTAETLPKGKNRVMGVSLGGGRSEGVRGEKPLENPPSARSRGVSPDPSGDAVFLERRWDEGIPRVALWAGGGFELTPFPLSQTIQIMTGFLHIGFGIVLTTLTNVYTSVFVIGEIPFLGGVSVRAGVREGMPTGEGYPPGKNA